MSNDQSIDSISSSISTMEIAPTRPQQYGKLALLPVELILQITGEPFSDKETLPAKDLKNLALSCSSLFYLIRPTYYLADNYSVFHSALKQADVDQMERCALFEAAPDTKWNVTDGCCCDVEEPHQHHRPIDVLLECVFIGSVSLERCIDALRWLLDKDYDAKEQGDQNWYVANDDCEHMPMILFNMLRTGCGRDRIGGICQMIRILRRYGYSLPYDVDLNSYVITSRRRLSFDPKRIQKPMDEAMRSHCPPYLLELVLQEYQRRSVDVIAWTKKCPPQMEEWVGFYLCPGEYEFEGCWIERRWYQLSSLGNLAWNLYADLLNSTTGWTEEYNGEVADIFEEKVKLLVKYHFVDQLEEQILRRILKALRNIAAMAVPLGGLDEDRDSKVCWHELCEALQPFGDRQDLEGCPERYYNFERLPQRVHRFVIEKEFNPWNMWHQDELQKPKARAKLSRYWIDDRLLQGPDESWYDLEWMRHTVWDSLLRCGVLPNWYEVDYDGFSAALEEFIVAGEAFYAADLAKASNY